MLLPKMNRWAIGKHSSDPFTGECKIVNNSSFRKLARAIRRGKVPEERMFIIETAKDKVKRHPLKYLHKTARMRAQSHGQ